jgi:hypothetical protein
MAGEQPWVGIEGHRPTHWGAQPIRISFPSQKGFITERTTPQVHQLSGWLVSGDPAGEEARCGGPGLAWLHIVCGCEAGWTYCRILLKQFWGWLMATALVDGRAIGMLTAQCVV